MGPKVKPAHQGDPIYPAPLVFVVTWEIQALKANKGPPLGAPQALRVHLEQTDRKEFLETLLMGPQDPQGRGVLQERLG